MGISNMEVEQMRKADVQKVVTILDGMWESHSQRHDRAKRCGCEEDAIRHNEACCTISSVRFVLDMLLNGDIGALDAQEKFYRFYIKK